MIERATTQVKSQPRRKSTKPRSLRYTATEQAGVGLLRIQVGKPGLKTTIVETYVVSEVPAHDGQGYQLVKVNHECPDVYHVLLCGLKTSCECKGFLRHQHCKHVDALRVCQEQGQC